MPTVTDADLGKEVLTEGVLGSIQMTVSPPGYDLHNDYLRFTDGDRVLLNVPITTSALSAGSFILSDIAIPFATLTLASIPAGSSFDIGLVTAPVLSALSPSTAVAGDPVDITLSCTGSAFTNATVIKFGDYDEPTTLVSDTEVTTIVKPSLFVNPDAVPVLVHTGPLESSPMDFTFTAATVTGESK
jgi:hypothetical protein